MTPRPTTSKVMVCACCGRTRVEAIAREMGRGPVTQYRVSRDGYLVGYFSSPAQVAAHVDLAQLRDADS